MRLPYDGHWAELRRRQRTCWWLFATYVPGAFLVGLPLSRVFNSSAPFFAVAGAWMVALGIAGNRVINWPCPRSGKPFMSTSWSSNSFARKCRHCKLPKWARDEVPIDNTRAKGAI
jgi:hypothetical protein